MLAALENRLVYFPTPMPDIPFPGLAAQDVYFTASDGTQLHAWLCRANSALPESSRPLILFFHGNAGSIWHRGDLLQRMRHRLSADVLILDYRGYGRSRGAPSESGLYADSRAAYSWVTGPGGVDPKRIILYGQSLGGGVALELALSVPHRGLVLESTFTSLPDVAKTLYPWLPVHRLMRNRYPNIERMARYDRPVLILHGDRDSLIPPSHAHRLFAVAVGPKRLVEIAGGDHNDVAYVNERAYFAAWLQFIAELFPATDY